MTGQISRVAIVNRGDAAIRFLHSAREYAGPGAPLCVIALYAEGEEDARFVRDADERVCLGPAEAIGADGARRLAFLDHVRLEQALREAAPDAVWPGWGFVSEAPAFVELCQRLGITFIGPGAEAMRMLGDKIAAKRLAESVDVPVADWSREPVASLEHAREEADRLGYPLLIKAAGGGGGRGIRKVAGPADLAAAYDAAVSEAAHAFGDPRVFLESLVAGARHIEAQVAADGTGTVWALGLRDCTLQRRHQKVLEEAGEALLPPALQIAVQDAAVRLCQAAGYRNVGTVEFLYRPGEQPDDPDGHAFYFMEVNPRLQVEHTVTEVITGVDLVGLQLHLAQGGTLEGDPPAPRGHAIQVRLAAEHPQTLAPAPGLLDVFDLPDGPGIRVDSGYRTGDVIPREYDSMIAKVIAGGRDRSQALARLRRALADLDVVVDRGATNRSFLARLVAEPTVAAMDYDTGWIDRELLARGRERDAALAVVAAAVETQLARTRDECAHFASTSARGRPETGGDRGPIRLQHEGSAYELQVRQVAPDRFQVAVHGTLVDLRRRVLGRHRTRITVGGRDAVVVCIEHGADLFLEIGDEAFVVGCGDAGLVRTGSPGVVISMNVAPGDLVEPGDVLAVVEAMKLEMPILAQAAGKVAEVIASVNVQLDAGDALLRLDLSTGADELTAAPDPGAHDSTARFADLVSAAVPVDPVPVLLGYDQPFDGHDFGAAEPARMIAVFQDLCGLTRSESHREPGLGETDTGGERLFHAFLRSPERAAELLTSAYVTRLDRLLGWYAGQGVPGRDGEPGEVLLRLYRAWQGLPLAVAGVVRLLRDALEGGCVPEWLSERDLDELVAVTERRFPVVAEWARTLRAGLFDFPESAVGPEISSDLIARFELDRLAEFDLRRCAAPRDVVLLHATARDHPGDERLFAFVEVTSATAIPQADGGVVFPELEVRLRAAVAAIRRTRLREAAATSAHRVVARVREPWRVTDAELTAVARRVAEDAQGLDLEKVVIRARTTNPGGTGMSDTVVHMAVPHMLGVSVGRSAPSDRPVSTRTPTQQRMARLRRRGTLSPYEIVDLLIAPSASDAMLPLGRFAEHDLDDQGRLRPVEREAGHNVANVVVGVIENDTPLHPEGMRRVIVLGDPAGSLGSLAEPECRRIIAALDLAERLGVPVEWFAVSSGAKVAMDSGTENLDWTAAVLRRIIEFTQTGGEINVVVAGINVGAQAYFDAEATMLMHTRGALIMTAPGSMVLTGKQALDASGGVSAEDNAGIGGFDRVMGPNGQAQYAAADLASACALLFRYYEHTYVAPGEPGPRPRPTTDPATRDVGASPHPTDLMPGFATVRDVFSDTHNPDRKKTFDIRAVMRAIVDRGEEPLERWAHWEGAETGVVWDARIGGRAVCLLGIESTSLRRRGPLPADGPREWTAGTLFPQSSKKLARAINAASGNRPVVVLANLSGFDGSPDSMRELQLEYGAELGRAVVNFRGPIVLVVLSRYHGGAFVVFSKELNPSLHVVAVEGARASVLGGTPAATVVFARDVNDRVAADARVAALTAQVAAADEPGRTALRAELADTAAEVRARAVGEVAAQFDAIHTIERARSVGSLDAIIGIESLRPHVIGQITHSSEEDRS